MTLLCLSFPGKIMDVHYAWRQNGWSGQKCWVSKSCRRNAQREKEETVLKTVRVKAGEEQLPT